MMRNVGFHANFKVINNFQTSARGSQQPRSCFAFREFLAIKSRLQYCAGKDKIRPGCLCFGMGLGQKEAKIENALRYFTFNQKLVHSKWKIFQMRQWQKQQFLNLVSVSCTCFIIGSNMKRLSSVRTVLPPFTIIKITLCRM